MKKSVLTVAFAAAGLLVASSVMAQTQGDKGGWFVNGNVGQANLDKGPYDGHATGYAVNGGYRWAVNPRVALGVELGYNDLGNIKVSKTFQSGDVYDTGRSKLRGWTTGVNGHFNITPEWYVSARAGAYGWKGHGLSNNDSPLRKSVNKTDWYSGVGVGYDVARNWSVGLNYDYYRAKKHSVDLSTDMISVGAEYRF